MQKCSCKGWKMYKIPFQHPCAAIESNSSSVYDFCDEYYKTYQDAYKDIINSTPTTDMHLDEVGSLLTDKHDIHAPDVHCQMSCRCMKRILLKTNFYLLICGRFH